MRLVHWLVAVKGQGSEYKKYKYIQKQAKNTQNTARLKDLTTAQINKHINSADSYSLRKCWQLWPFDNDCQGCLSRPKRFNHQKPLTALKIIMIQVGPGDIIAQVAIVRQPQGSFKCF